MYEFEVSVNFSSSFIYVNWSLMLPFIKKLSFIYK